MDRVDSKRTFEAIKDKYDACGAGGRSLFDVKKIIFANNDYYSWFVHKYVSSKAQGGVDSILFGVKNITFDQYIKSLIKGAVGDKSFDGGSVDVASANDFRNELVALLLENKDGLCKYSKNIENYLEAKGGGKIDGVRLFDFASRMAKCFKGYEDADLWSKIDELGSIDSAEAKESIAWQKKLYYDIKKRTALSFFHDKKDEVVKLIKNDDVLFVDFNPFFLKTNLFANYLSQKAKGDKGLKGKFVEAISARSDKAGINNSIVLSKAASKIREVENLYNQICTLIKNKDVENLEDVAVYCPNIADYYVAIMQVFNCHKGDTASQSSLGEFDSDGYPVIPISINIPSSHISTVANGVNVLDKISKKGYYDRCDVALLLENKAVQEAIGLIADDVKNIKSWISGMNIYRDVQRDGEVLKNWQNSANRLLAGMLIDDYCLLELGDYEKIKAFSNLNSGDKDLLDKYFRIIKALDSFCELSKLDYNEGGIDKENARRLFGILHCLFDVKDSSEDELKSEQRVFDNIIYELNSFFDAVFAKVDRVPFDCAIGAVKNSASGVPIRVSSSLKGVSFSSLSEDSIVPKKYTFLLGMGLDNYPRPQSTSALDLANIKVDGAEVFRQKDADDKLLEAIYSYTSSKLYISYNYIDLQKDAELYLSSSVLNLFSKIEFDVPYDKLKASGREKITAWIKDNQYSVELDSIKLKDSKDNSKKSDDYKYIYTQRQARNIESLKISKNNSIKHQTLPCFELPQDSDGNKVVKIKQMSKYLKDPFVFRLNQLFGQEKDWFENTPLEPIELNNLERSIEFKERITDKLDYAKLQQADLQEKYGLNKDFLALSKEGDKLDAEADKIFARIADSYSDIENDPKLKEPDKDRVINIISDDLVMGGTAEDTLKEIQMADGKSCFRITGNLNWYALYENERKLVVVDCKEKRKDNNSDFLDMYITSLCVLAKVQSEGKFKVCMWNLSTGGKSTVYQGKITKDAATYRTFYISKDEAERVLSLICFNIEKNYPCCDLDLVSDSSITSLGALEDKLFEQYNGRWKNFDYKFLVDFDADSGYSQGGFAKEWANECSCRKELVKYVE